MRFPVSLERCLGSLPPDYGIERGKRGVLAARRDLLGELGRAGFGPDDERPLERSELSGRRPLWRLELASASLLVRRFHHGGLLRGVARERFADPARPFRELALARALLDAGIPTPSVVGARAQHAKGFGWRLELATERVDGALDLLRALERCSPGRPAERLRPRLFEESGAFVGRLHRAGLLHADLTPRNLLLDERALVSGEFHFWVLDLDRSELRPPLSVGERAANLARLLRFVLRRRARGECGFTRADLWRFLRRYARGGGDDVRALGRSVERRFRRSRWAHRLGWLVEERLGAGPAARDGRG